MIKKLNKKSVAIHNDEVIFDEMEVRQSWKEYFNHVLYKGMIEVCWRVELERMLLSKKKQMKKVTNAAVTLTNCKVVSKDGANRKFIYLKM